jgi:superfamily II DNA or RNA helicase
VGGDYASDELADTVNTPMRNKLIVKAWEEKGKNSSTVAFTVDIQHAKDLAQMFRDHGHTAEAIWGDDPERAQKLADHRAGKIKILTNCGILVEGYDDWQIMCIILARPTKSSVLFTQMVGRGTRLQEGCENLLTDFRQAWKQDCIIIDVVDSCTRLSLITLPTLMGLAANLDLKGQGVYDVAKKVEEEAKKFPHIDFTKLADIDNIQQFIEEVNLFDIKFLPEVENNSDFTWYPSATGGYILMLPKQSPTQTADRVTIEQNLLDNWEIRGTIKGKRYKGERGTIEEAFTAADGIIRTTSSEALKVLSREATWHKDPATEGQIRMLNKLYKGKALPLDMDKGKASRLISSFIAGKA